MEYIIISVGASCKSTRWENTVMTWSEFAAKLGRTIRTSETEAEYHAATKAVQSAAKDVGGFVGGEVVGGRRKKGSVSQRYILTLDLDTPETPVDYDKIFRSVGAAAVIYSTHSHTEKKPRLRLVVLLDKPLAPDDYERVSRAVGFVVGDEQLDPSTHQVERLMYWPSTPRDGEFIYKVSPHTAPLPTDEWVAYFHQLADHLNVNVTNTRQANQPPTTPTTAAAAKSVELLADVKDFSELRTAHPDRAEDPRKKRGIVGTFCRVFTMSQAITRFLAHLYTTTQQNDRYTYVHGSTAGGLVLYNDLWAYSHHATDPASMLLCNAFDLVRIHLFGQRDAKAGKVENSTELPSFSAMTEYASSLPDIMAEMRKEAKERKAAIMEDFTEEEEEESVGEAKRERKKKEVKDPLELLVTDKNGCTLGTYENIDNILINDPELKGLFKYDLFNQATLITRDFATHTHAGGEGVRYNDTDFSNVKVYLECNYKMKSGGGEKTRERIEAVARMHAFHPIRDYLNSLEWDGVPRVEKMFVTYNGAIDEPLTYAVTRNTMTAAVARIFSPGVKFDYVTVLQGAEGTAKSTVIKLLGLEKWNKENLSGMGAERNAAEQLRGAWLIELSELSGMKRAEVEEVKAFVSTCVDIYRPAYARAPETFPRQCIFIGTTNELDFLKGTTGNRRFWVLPCKMKQMKNPPIEDLTPDVVGQIWAEAVQMYKHVKRDLAGNPILRLSYEDEQLMRKRQEEYNEHAYDGTRETIQYFLDQYVDSTGATIDTDLTPILPGSVYKRRQKTCVAEIVQEAFGLMRGNAKYDQYKKVVIQYMNNSDEWEARSAVRIKGRGRQRGFVRKDAFPWEEEDVGEEDDMKDFDI